MEDSPPVGRDPIREKAWKRRSAWLEEKTGAFVRNGEAEEVLVIPLHRIEAHRDEAFRGRELDGVAEEIAEDLLETSGIGADEGFRRARLIASSMVWAFSAANRRAAFTSYSTRRGRLIGERSSWSGWFRGCWHRGRLSRGEAFERRPVESPPCIRAGWPGVVESSINSANWEMAPSGPRRSWARDIEKLGFDAGGFLGLGFSLFGNHKEFFQIFLARPFSSGLALDAFGFVEGAQAGGLADGLFVQNRFPILLV